MVQSIDLCPPVPEHDGGTNEYADDEDHNLKRHWIEVSETGDQRAVYPAGANRDIASGSRSGAGR